MSTIDGLKYLLDDHGVKHHDHYFDTSWFVGEITYTAHERLDGTLVVDNLTPKQAIAATLSGRECELEIKDNMDESEGTGVVWWECSSCHWKIEFFNAKWLEHAKFCPECGSRIRKAVKR